MSPICWPGTWTPTHPVGTSTARENGRATTLARTAENLTTSSPGSWLRAPASGPLPGGRTRPLKSSDSPIPDQTDHPGEPIAVTAAGALPWRVKKDQLEVLLIHRPRYDDWSWPKGKLDPGETVPECAVREVEEEIGLTAPLGIPLPPIHYHVSAGLKIGHYWAVDVDGAALIPDGTEVDSVMWCPPEKAARLLS